MIEVRIMLSDGGRMDAPAMSRRLIFEDGTVRNSAHQRPAGFSQATGSHRSVLPNSRSGLPSILAPRWGRSPLRGGVKLSTSGSGRKTAEQHDGDSRSCACHFSSKKVTSAVIHSLALAISSLTSYWVVTDLLRVCNIG